MRISHRYTTFLLLVATLSATTITVLARSRAKVLATSLNEHQRALHALNRLTFGPRPGEVERVEQLGVDKWIEQQLHPEKIADSAVDSRLAPYRTLRMNAREMAEEFPPAPLVKAVMDGKLPMPSDARRRAVYESQIARLRERKDQKQAAGADNTMVQSADNPDHNDRQFARERADALFQMQPDQRYRAILAMNPDDRWIVAQRLSPPERLRLVSDMQPEQRETVMALGNPQAVVESELMNAKLLRAIYSDRQLEEVMTDFWLNHFNVFINKGADRYLVTEYERDVIRPHALGKFKDLLMATAKSPAMLFYLDNWLSVGPNSEFAVYGPKRAAMPPTGACRMTRRGWVFCRPARVPRPRPKNGQKKAQSGLNENYARELMELHTLGVNAGYTQKDVTEVARVFTGWTLQEPRRGGGFEFDDRKHEPGDKYVLGHKIKQHGEKEADEVLEILAKHPSTARFISTKLAQRFVSDDPPQSLVESMARTFTNTNGDIREVLRTMFHSPEFWSAETVNARVKTPLEFVASAVRATSADVNDPTALIQVLNRMGMPLYGAQPPTGYKTTAETWVNSSALLNRMNFALALAANKLPGVTVSPTPQLVAGSPDQLLTQLQQSLLDGEVSAHTHETILKQLNDQPKQANSSLITGLIVGSPEFQRK